MQEENPEWTKPTITEDAPLKSWAALAFAQSVAWANKAEHLKGTGDPIWTLADSAATMLRVFANAASRRQ